MVRVFEVRAYKADLVKCLASDLNSKLGELQRDGWRIISATSTPCTEWDYPNSFNSTLFTIIAQKDEK